MNIVLIFDSYNYPNRGLEKFMGLGSWARPVVNWYGRQRCGGGGGVRKTSFGWKMGLNNPSVYVNYSVTNQNND